MTCPRCGGPCNQPEEIDGRGCGPWGCPSCHWIEGDPENQVETLEIGEDVQELPADGSSNTTVS